MLPYRATPVPLAAAALLLAMWVFTSEAGSITRARCDADMQELMGEIEKNRETTLAQIKTQLAEEKDPDRQLGLETMREQVWDQEEQERGQANYIWRDCMSAARKRS